MRTQTSPITVSVLVATALLCGACSGGSGDFSAVPAAPTPADERYGIASDVFSGYEASAGAQYVEHDWPDGSLRSRGYEIDPAGSAVKVGPYESWHDNGAKASEGSWQDGLRHGYWHQWHDNGTVQLEGWFVAGELDRSRFWVERDAAGAWLGGANPP